MLKRLISNYRIYRKTFKELSSLTDRELADIGISRCDIPNISREVIHEKTLDSA